MHAIDPFGGELKELPATCRSIGQGWARAETLRVRERANDALLHGCAFARK
jgi:hypothetical protein